MPAYAGIQEAPDYINAKIMDSGIRRNDEVLVRNIEFEYADALVSSKT